MNKYDDSIGRKSSPACDVCGQAPEGTWHRHVDAGRTYDYRPHARNRILVEPHYAALAGRPDLANKRMCPACYGELISRPINR